MLRRDLLSKPSTVRDSSRRTCGSRPSLALSGLVDPSLKSTEDSARQIQILRDQLAESEKERAVLEDKTLKLQLEFHEKMYQIRHENHEQVLKLQQQIVKLQEDKHDILTDTAKAAIQYVKRISDLELEKLEGAGANSRKRSRT